MRLQSVDFLRGLALTIVLLDHTHWWANEAGFFLDWTLFGLGFSDVAEAFVFLSAYTFGWVYSARLERLGYPACQKLAVVRAAQIYGSYVATVALLASLGLALRDTPATLYPVIKIDDAAMLRDAIGEALVLKYQPFAMGILCLYIVTLPFLPAILESYRRHGWPALAISAAAYATVQLTPRFNLPRHAGEDWLFNPFAWQFLLVLGMACGSRFRDRAVTAPRQRLLTAGAVLLVLYGILVKKGQPLFGESSAGLAALPVGFWEPPLVSKTTMAPIRLLHFLAVAHLVTCLLPKDGSFWSHPLAKPFVFCGRHSLPVYCAGVVLTYVSIIALHAFGTGFLTLIVIPLDACLLQFAFALWLERRRRKRDAETAPSGAREEFVRTTRDT